MAFPPLQEEFISSLAAWKDKGTLYLMVQSPIFHVEAMDMASAVKLRNLAQAHGFKYSTIRSIKLDRATHEPVKITVEILSSENLHAPLGENGEIKADSDYIEFLLERAIHHFNRAWDNLNKLKEGLSHQESS